MVVSNEPPEISSVRATLGSRQASESKFRITGAMLKRANPGDFATVESILDRWSTLSNAERAALTNKVVPVLARRLQTEAPELPDHQQFLEDLLAAEYRRQSRSIG